MDACRKIEWGSNRLTLTHFPLLSFDILECIIVDARRTRYLNNFNFRCPGYFAYSECESPFRAIGGINKFAEVIGAE